MENEPARPIWTGTPYRNAKKRIGSGFFAFCGQLCLAAPDQFVTQTQEQLEVRWLSQSVSVGDFFHDDVMISSSVCRPRKNLQVARTTFSCS